MGNITGKLWVALQLAGRYVVSNRVRRNVTYRILYRDILGILSYDDAKLPLIVSLVVLRNFGNDNVGTVI